MIKQSSGRRGKYFRILGIVFVIGLLVFNLTNNVAKAVTQSGNVKVAARVPGPPPSVASTITQPKTGDVLRNSPIEVKGDCPEKGLIIKIIDNGHFVGSTICTGSGNFSLSISLFLGKNTLVAQEFDALNQRGPDSAPVIVSFGPTSSNTVAIAKAGISHLMISLMENYNGYSGCVPGQQFNLPLRVSGGVPPYAVYIDWADGSSSLASLKNSKEPLIANHNYKQAGNYQINVTASDDANQHTLLSIMVVIDGPAPSVAAQIGNVAKSIWHLNWYYQLEGISLLIIGYLWGRFSHSPKTKKSKKPSLRYLSGAVRRGP